MKPHLRIVAPTTVNRTVTPRRRPNAEIRTREHLTEAEVEKLIKAASKNRYGHRDATMILVAYRHGLRASANWSTFAGIRSTSTTPRCTSAGSSRARRRRIRSWATNYGRCAGCSASRSPSRRSCSRPSEARRSARAGFAKLVERAGEAAGLGFKAHPHMLRHACGFALANKGHDTRALQAYLGHKNIQHTVRYTELSPDRFKDFWRD